MFTINLLPLRDRKMIRFEEARRIVRFFAVFFSAVMVIGISLLAPSYLPLTFEKWELERTLGLQKDAARLFKVEEARNLTRIINLSLTSLKNFSRDTRKASLILEDFFSNAGKAVFIESVTLKKNGDVVISGKAQNRRDLLNFEKELRGLGKFAEISVRLADIVKGTDINFNLQGKLKSEFGL